MARARAIGTEFEEIAGETPIKLPMAIEGPLPESWSAIARSTLELSNQVAELEALGVDPVTYPTSDFRNIGGFLSKIAEDFNARTRQLLAELSKPTQLVIGFASETRDVGTLAQLTEGRRLGLLNAHALYGATPGTEIGRWWGDRMGLLTSTIVRLSARAYVLPPTLTVTSLRRSGNDEVRMLLAGIDVADVDPVPYWQRSDVGRFLLGEERDTPETRGNPSDDKTAAFGLLGEGGHFSGGRDKLLNAALARSIQGFLTTSERATVSVTSEIQLDTPSNNGGNVIPDIYVEEADVRTCLELTWRQGDWITTTNRAAIAEYILKKLRSYAQALGWTA